MADETDNLVLQLLREIRATQSVHSRMLAEHQKSFTEMRDELRAVGDNAVYAAGFAVLGRRDTEGIGQRVMKLETRVAKLEENARS